jgi:hypothetical protein
MASNDIGPCFIVIGIVFIVLDFIMFYTLYFTLMGVFFICMGCAASHKKVTATPKYTSPAISQQTSQPVYQKSASPVQPIPEIKKSEPILEKHKYCPYCGEIANGDYCSECGEKID